MPVRAFGRPRAGERAVMPGGFCSVILDVDSTLCGIEGIDWLARRRGAEACARVTELTDRAMRGEIPLQSVYGERLALVQPSRADIEALADAYAAALAPHAAICLHRLRTAGRHVVLVSGGVREAILPVAARLGIEARDVNAVSVRFGAGGGFAGFDSASPLTTAAGKCAVATALALEPRVLAVGDGATDLAMRPAIAAFAAFTGFVRREPVVAAADFVVESFDQLVDLVLSA